MKFYFFFTLFLLLITGCTLSNESQTTTPTININENGLSIINFSTNFNVLRVNEATNIKLLLFNNGDFEAKNIQTILYGEGMLTRSNEKNFTERLLPEKRDIQYWTLTAPLALSQTESTTYVISSKIYYDYNFSGTQQVAIVPATYSGDEIPLSSTSKKSPLKTTIKARNPIRTITSDTTDDTIFTITAIITNTGKGLINYYECSPQRGCRKNSYLNDFSITIPSSWSEVTDFSYWIKTENNEASEVTYSLNFDELNTEYEDNNCATSQSDTCSKINKAINYLKMIRGDEARIILQFSTPTVDEITINSVKVKGSFSYEVDASDFTNKIAILVRGD